MNSGTGEQCKRSKSENLTLGWKGCQLSWQTNCSISLDSLTNHKVGKLFPSHCSGGKILLLLFLLIVSSFMLEASLPSSFWLFLEQLQVLRPFFEGQPFWTKNYSHLSPLNTKPLSVMLSCGLRSCRIERLSYYHISPCTFAVGQRAELILWDLWRCFLYKGNDRVKIQTFLGGSSCTN